MIRYLLIALCIFGSKISLGSYIETSLIQLVERADCISYSRIVSVGKEDFKVLVIRNVKSCRRNDTITIQKFKDWTCASRYSGYTVGQEAIFFLSSDKGKLVPIGAANEGELIVKNDTGYVRSGTGQNLKAKSVNFIPTYSTFIPMPVQTIVEGLNLYLENRVTIDQQYASQKGTGRVVYRYDYAAMLPNNDFLTLLIDQKQEGF